MSVSNFPLILAHAGGGASAPENTLAAFQGGLLNGADGFELDVHLSKDGIPVLIHDFTLERTTGSRAAVKDLTVNELRKLDAGSWFSPKFSNQYIPTLDEALALCAGGTVTVNIEIKAGSRFYPGIEEKCLQVVARHPYITRVIYSSFDHYALVRIKEIDSQVVTGALHGCSLVDAHIYAQKIGVDALHPQFMVLEPAYMAACREVNIMVNTWTVNEIVLARQLKALGVDAIITDDPAKIRAGLA